MKNIKKKLYILVGFIAVVLGGIGVVLPGLPTVPFLLLALFCFSKSSQKYHDMLLKNKYFGKALSDYYEGRGLTKAVKIKAIIFLSCGMGFSIYKLQNFHMRIFLVAVWIGVATHLILLKNKPR